MSDIVVSPNGPHSPLPVEFKHHEKSANHHHQHQHPHGFREAETTRDLEAEIAIKTQEIHQMRTESQGLEAKLLHNEEVLQVKEHELGVLEGRLMTEQDNAGQRKEATAHPDFVASTRS